VRVNESDFIQGPAGSTTVAGLGQDDPVIKPIAQNISVESGTYRFEATLARSPQ
jgi:hypothetical protein